MTKPLHENNKNLLTHHLKQEVPIQWNSTYYTVGQFLEQEKAVDDFADQGKVGE